ncbi:hypothetical protein [Jiangella endophytica]|uniref:hypothetical protein n=1 Tax=Jiangella endophytica TaxID=1623398 RepID=UPI000E34177A|nr:hypothetical protein [Jiangella endophytica]
MTDAARAALADAVSLWRLTPAVAKDVIDAATDALVAGLDSPSLRILAGEPASATAYELADLIDDTMCELGLADVLEDDVQRAALAAMLRRLRAGRVRPGELVSWAHVCIGHGGHDDAQPFVQLDDVYDLWASEGHDLGLLDRWTHEEADAFLAGLPSPGRADEWMSGPPPAATPARPPVARPSPPRRGRFARLFARRRS